MQELKQKFFKDHTGRHRVQLQEVVKLDQVTCQETLDSACFGSHLHLVFVSGKYT